MSTPSSGAPRFTAHASACAEHGKEKFFRSASASSDISADAAKELARQLARQRAEAAASGLKPLTRDGEYPYPERVLVEPVLDRVMLSTGGEPGEIARVTRNSYDASVLNAYQTMFVDVDTVADTSNASGEQIVSQAEAIDALVSLTQTRRDLQFRVYATRAGLRYLCTSRLFDPRTDESRDILARLKADKRYATLCRVQKCYRARLTPKHWRCILPPAPRNFFARLLRTSGSVADLSKFATCRFLETVGDPQPIHPAIDPILRLHDLTTESASAKPLA